MGSPGTSCGLICEIVVREGERWESWGRGVEIVGGIISNENVGIFLEFWRSRGDFGYAVAGDSWVW